MNCEKCGSPLVEENGTMVCKSCAGLVDVNVVPETPVVEVAETPVVDTPVVETPVVEVTETPVVEVAPEVNVVEPVVEVAPETPVVESAPVVEAPVTPEVDVVATEVVSEGVMPEVTNEAVTNDVAAAVDNAVSADAGLVDNAVTEVKCAKCGNMMKSTDPSCPHCAMMGGDNAPVVEPKKGKGKLIAIIAVVLVLIVGALAGGYFYFNSKATDSKAIISQMLNQVMSKYKTTSTELTTATKVGFEYNAKVVSAESNAITKLITNLGLSGTVAVDMKNQRADMSFNVKYADAPMVNAGVVAQDNKVYLGLGDLYDKYLDLEIDEEEYKSIFESTKVEEDKGTYLILDTLKKTIETSIKENEYTHENTTYDMGGKKVKAVKHTLKISKERYIQLFIDFLTKMDTKEGAQALVDAGILEPQIDYDAYYEAMDRGEELDDYPTQDPKIALKELIEEFKNYNFEEEVATDMVVNYYISFFGGELLKVDADINVTEYDYWEEKNITTVNHLSLAQAGENKYSFDYSTTTGDDKTEYKGTYVYEPSNKVTTITLNNVPTEADETNTTVTLTMNNSSIKIKVLATHGTSDSAEINLNFTVEDLTEVAKKDVSNAVTMSTLSDTDMMNITSKLENNVAFTAFSTDLTAVISELLGGFTPSLDPSLDADVGI